MSKTRPQISVLMPVYNGEKYLPEAIESILYQTYANFEFIILNDGSTDKTEEIILSYDDPRIVYVKNETNLQIVKTLNKGIALAKGEYIARMDADDISLPQRFAKQIEHLTKNRDIDILGTQYVNFGAFESFSSNPLSHEEIKVALLFNSAMAHPTVMMRSNVFQKIKYQEVFNKAEDYALWVEAVDTFRFANLPEYLLKYRRHRSQTDQEIQTSAADTIRKIMFEKSFCADDAASINRINKIATHQYII